MSDMSPVQLAGVVQARWWTIKVPLGGDGPRLPTRPRTPEGVYLIAGLLLGSVASQVTAHGRRPVVAVRAAPVGDGPVVVGVDGSRGVTAAPGGGERCNPRR